MTKHIISSNTNQPLLAKGSNNTWIIDNGASIITGLPFHEVAVSDAKSTHDNTIVIKGAVIGGPDGEDYGIVIHGRDTHVAVGQYGVVQGDAGIYAHGKNLSVANHGAITASWTGIFTDHGGTIVNDGTIDAGSGIWSNSGAVRIVNEFGAEIIADGTAINVQGTEASSRIINHGTIKAYYYAVDGGDLSDVITNRGTMEGTIALGGGNDLFDNRGGSVDHDINTESGNDTLITDDENVRLSENQGGGNDTVKSTVSYVLNDYVENLVLLGKMAGVATGNEMNNHLDGNSAANTIQGMAGKDRLDGHQGNDILFGGLQADVFVFSKGSDDDTISDFVAGLDRVDLRGSQIASFADFKAHATDTGVDVMLHSGKDSLRIQGIDLTDLHASDFIF